MATPADDVSCRSFVYPEFLAAEGPITAQNAMDYFQTSIFWDTSSNNATLRMQTMHTGLPVPDEEGQLRKFVGIEFWLVHAQPPNLFIIHKRERLSPDEVRVLAAYFIMNDVIYCAPDIYSVISGRLRSSLYNLRSSLDLLRQHRPEFTPRKGHLWTVEMATTNPLLQGKEDSKKTQAASDIAQPGDALDINTSQYEKGTEPKQEKQPSNKTATSSNKRTEIRPLLRAMETTRRYVEQRTADSRMDILPSNNSVPPTPGMLGSLPDAGTTPQIGSLAQTFTMTGSSTGFTPAVGGSTGAGSGTDIRRSTSIGMGTPGPGAASPETPGMNAGIPGIPGAGKKKRKRQANVAIKKAAAGASPDAEGANPASPSIASPPALGLK